MAAIDADGRMGRRRAKIPSLRAARLAVGLAAAAFSLWRALPADAADAANFHGKTISIVVGFGTGGGYALYAQILADRLGAYLPGDPKVVVQSMPGAGGLTAADYLFNSAPRDGTTIGMIAQTAAIAQIAAAAGVHYRVEQFDWIGRIAANVEVEEIWSKSGVASMQDAEKRRVVVAGTGVDSSSVVFPRLLNRLIGTKFQVVPGYQGDSMASLAMERGEVDGLVRPWSVTKSVHPEWLRDHKINLIVQYVLRRRSDLQDVPAVVEFGRTPEQKQILALFASGGEIGRAILAPPQEPPSILAALRNGFAKTMADPAFLAEARRARLDLDPLGGAHLQQTIVDMLKIPEAAQEQARSLDAAISASDQ
jgi:tripartite-type tricarboxylate transporter receptor subunit TctC